MEQISVSQLCFANAARDERVEEYRYGNRHERMVEYISNLKSSVVSLKEVRDCMDKNGVVREALWFISDICCNSRYKLAALEKVKLHPTNGVPVYNPMHLCQLYDASVLHKRQTHMFWYYEKVFGINEPPHFGTMVLACQYELVEHPGLFIIVESFHLPCNKEQKEDVCHWIVTEYPKERRRVFKSVENIIRIGDFNNFKDEDTSDIQLQDISKNMRLASGTMLDRDTKTPLYGTFYPFPHDACSVPIEKPDIKSIHNSVLDYAFYKSNGVLKPNKCTLFWSCDDLDRVRLSDHLPMEVSFNLDVDLYYKNRIKHQLRGDVLIQWTVLEDCPKYPNEMFPGLIFDEKLLTSTTVHKLGFVRSLQNSRMYDVTYSLSVGPLDPQVGLTDDFGDEKLPSISISKQKLIDLLVHYMRLINSDSNLKKTMCVNFSRKNDRFVGPEEEEDSLDTVAW